jgi:hypothetical protein
VRGFLKFIMYFGVAMGLVGYLYPIDDARVGLDLPYRINQILSFGGLGLIVIGFIGRQVTKPED